MSRKTLFGALLTIVALLAAVPAASAAERPYEPDTVIVKYRSTAATTAVDALADRLGLGATVDRIRHSGAKVVAVTGDPAAVAQRLQRSSAVAYAEPDYVLTASATPNDPRYGELYGLNNTGQTGGTTDADIDAPEGWDAAGLGAFPATGGAKVGIVDTGIQSNHPDLLGKVVALRQVAGAPADLRGHDPRGQLRRRQRPRHARRRHDQRQREQRDRRHRRFVQLAAGDLQGPRRAARQRHTSDVANCITWVHDKGAKVISMSLGGGASTTLQSAVDYAWKGGAANGSVLIAAAGNDGDATLNYPAAYGNVVSVAATDDADARADFSNANADVEIAAPGVDVLSTYTSSGYSSLSGTSMATPHVAGVTAVIRTRNPAATASQVVTRLDAAATDDLGPAGRDQEFGFGRVNLLKAATG